MDAFEPSVFNMFPQNLLCAPFNHIFFLLIIVITEAFFDMYVGDLPVSVQAKQEIASNVGGLIKRCWEIEVVHLIDGQNYFILL